MKQFLFALIAGIMLASCAATRYNIAENHLNDGQNKAALREYIKLLHEDKRQHGGYTDIKAMLGVAAAYYGMKQYGKTQSMCKRILKIDSNNGGALFYAGASLEAISKLKWAKKFYKRYRLLPDHDPYRRFMQARLEILMKDQLAQEMQEAIRRERTISPNDVPQNTVAVLYFLNQDQDPEWSALSTGLTEMMITDMAQVKQLDVVERAKMQMLLDEMNLDKTMMADPNTVPRFGKLLKAKILVNGAFSLPGGKDLLITSNIGDIAQASTFEALRFSGKLDNIFRMEKDLVLSVIDQLGIQLSFEERNQIMQIPTENLQAFKAYCFGLEQMDKGNLSIATNYFGEAVKLDPNFQPAQQKLQLVDAMNLLASNQPIIGSIRPKTRGAGGQVSGAPVLAIRPSVTQRLMRISNNLDMGYLPGNDSREDITEVKEGLKDTDISIYREPLQEPPHTPDHYDE